MAANRRPHAPANAIAYHSSTQNLAHGKTHAGTGGTAAFAVKRRHVAGKVFPARLVNHLKIGVPQQSHIPWEALRNLFCRLVHGWSGTQSGHC
jgi:hypothetical protein